MSALPEIAREAGIDPVVCPHCGRHISTGEALELLFETILRRVRRGEVVKVKGFGSFELRTRTGKGVAKSAGRYRILGFRTAQRAKLYLRGGLG